MNLIGSEKTMTVKEVADVFKVSGSSVKRAVKRFFPNKMENGKKTLLNEIEVTIIKKELERHHNHYDKTLNTSDLKTIINYIGGEK